MTLRMSPELRERLDAARKADVDPNTGEPRRQSLTAEIIHRLSQSLEKGVRRASK